MKPTQQPQSIKIPKELLKKFIKSVIIEMAQEGTLQAILEEAAVDMANSKGGETSLHERRAVAPIVQPVFVTQNQQGQYVQLPYAQPVVSPSIFQVPSQLQPGQQPQVVAPVLGNIPTEFINGATQTANLAEQAHANMFPLANAITTAQGQQGQPVSQQQTWQRLAFSSQMKNRPAGGSTPATYKPGSFD